MFLSKRILGVGFWVVLLIGAEFASAHDPSAYGGLFRSRDFGGIWLNADAGLFLGGALALAVNPADPNHLLLGTDSRLLASRSGGRDWKQEAPAMLFGAIFAVTFLSDGKTALCSTPAGIFRYENEDWRQVAAPTQASPSRSIVLGTAPQRIYLVGRHDFYRSDDTGRNWAKIESDLSGNAEFTALAIVAQPEETLYAIADGRVVMSKDQGVTWQSRNMGLPDTGSEALFVDPSQPQRLWVANSNRIYRSDDGGTHWRTIGQPLPEAGTNVRGIAADVSGSILVLTTHRGAYRSADGGQVWGLLEGNLPVHLEARPLVRDLSHEGTLYAGFSLMPYGEIWRIAVEGGNLLGKLDVVNLAGGAAFFLLLCLTGFFLARWLVRRRDASDVLMRTIDK